MQRRKEEGGSRERQGVEGYLMYHFFLLLLLFFSFSPSSLPLLLYAFSSATIGSRFSRLLSCCLAETWVNSPHRRNLYIHKIKVYHRNTHTHTHTQLQKLSQSHTCTEETPNVIHQQTKSHNCKATNKYYQNPHI